MDPLFVKEMTKAVLEAENQDAARRTVGKAPSPTFAVPESLYAALMARLHRLGPAKEVAQIGATIVSFERLPMSVAALKGHARGPRLGATARPGHVT
jgi:hypothetical protein